MFSFSPPFISLLFPCSPAERAWFRLSAGNAILKICEQKGVGDKYTLEQFYTFSRLFVDPVPQVRERILIKLHKVREKSIIASPHPSFSNPALYDGIPQGNSRLVDEWMEFSNSSNKLEITQ